MWNLKYNTNKPIYETERDSQRKWTVAKWGRRCAGEMERKVGVSKCKLVHREWINDQAHCTAQRTTFNSL